MLGSLWLGPGALLLVGLRLSEPLSQVAGLGLVSTGIERPSLRLAMVSFGLFRAGLPMPLGELEEIVS